jgi:hypothetical protein
MAKTFRKVKGSASTSQLVQSEKKRCQAAAQVNPFCLFLIYTLNGMPWGLKLVFLLQKNLISAQRQTILLILLW